MSKLSESTKALRESTEQIHARWEREREERERLDEFHDRLFIKAASFVVGGVVVILGICGVFMLLEAVAMVAEEYGLPGVGLFAAGICVLIYSRWIGKAILGWDFRRRHGHGN